MAETELQHSKANFDAKARLSEASASQEHSAELLAQMCDRAQGVASPDRAARLLRLSSFAERTNHGMRSAILRDVQQKFGNRVAQRVIGEARKSASTALKVETLGLPRGGGEPLPPEHQGAFEQALGQPLDHVRVHSGDDARQAADALGAEAFAIGSDIYFSRGSYAPGTPEGDTRLGHELIHVGQHDAGRIPPPSSSEDTVSKRTDPLEQEAYANENAVALRAGAIRGGPSGGGHFSASPTHSNLNGNVTPVLHRRPTPANILRDDADPDAQRVQTLRNNFYDAVTASSWGDAAVILNGFNDSDIRRMLKDLTSAQLEMLRSGALERMPGWSGHVVAPIEELARQRNESVRIAKLERNYKDSITQGDWKQAAILLNGFTETDIKNKIRALAPNEVQAIRDAAPDWATRVIGPLEAIAGPRSASAPKEDVSAGAGKPVSEMTKIEKLSRAIDYAREARDGKFREQLEALKTRQSIFAMAAFAALFIAAQFTPAGWVADAIALTSLTLTAIFLGSAVFHVFTNLGIFVGAIDATTEDDLKTSGEALAEAVAEVGIGLIIAFLTHAAGGTLKGAKPYTEPPPGFADAVTPEGQVIQAPESAFRAPESPPADIASRLKAPELEPKISSTPEAQTTAAPEKVSVAPKPGEPGSPEHKAARWSEYETRGGKWDYERWSKAYENNMARARVANTAADSYQKQLGWGQREVTVEVEGVARRIDIADVAARRGVEVKGGDQFATQANLWEVMRDKILVEQGWDIEWHFEGTASGPLLKALAEAKIKVTGAGQP
jgi:hypothetical protein